MTKFDLINWNFNQMPTSGVFGEGYSQLETIRLLIGLINQMITSGNLADDEIEYLKKQATYLSESGDFTGTWNGLQMHQSDLGLSTDWNNAKGVFNSVAERLTDMTSDINQASTESSYTHDKVTPTINTLINSVLKGKDGTSLKIGCWGDSVYWGHASGVNPLGSQVANPVPSIIEDILYSYFQNGNIVVNNHGVKGQTTNDILSSWETSMSTSDENIIFINWGINDGKDEGLTPEVYRTNLRFIIDTAKENGKEVICDIPNIVLGGDSAGDGMGSYIHSQNVKLYGEIMRSVANEYNCYVIDTYEKSQKYNYDLEYVPNTMPDGMHPSDTMYYFKALQMCEPFLSPFCSKVSHGNIISCVDSSVRYFGTSAAPHNPINRCGFSLMADKIKVAINLKEKSDIYLALPQWANATNQCQILLDGDSLGVVDLREIGYSTGMGYVQNMEVLIKENVPSGIHLIELIKLEADVTMSVGLDYVTIRKPSKINVVKTDAEVNATYTWTRNVTKMENVEVNFTEGTQVELLVDIPTSRFLKEIDLEFTAHLNINEGVFVMGTHRCTTNVGLGGVALYLNSAGKLNFSEGAVSAYGFNSLLSDTVYSGESHKYRLKVSTSGVCSIYVDDVLITTKNMSTKRIGGYLGFHKTGTFGTMKIDSLILRQ